MDPLTAAPGSETTLVPPDTLEAAAEPMALTPPFDTQTDEGRTKGSDKTSSKEHQTTLRGRSFKVTKAARSYSTTGGVQETKE